MPKEATASKLKPSGTPSHPPAPLGAERPRLEGDQPGLTAPAGARPGSSEVTTTILLIDTSLRGAGMGLLAVGPDRRTTPQGSGTPLSDFLWHRQHPDNAGSIGALNQLLTEGLQVTGLEPDQIKGLAVSTGPGSFTGIKIGLAFAYGWALGAKSPPLWLGPSALACASFRWSRLSGDRNVALFLPATRTHGYVARYAPHMSVYTQLVDTTNGALMTELTESLTPCQVIVADEWHELELTLQKAYRPYERRPLKEVSLWALHGMAEAAAKAWPQEMSQKPPSPNYLRLSTAEEALAKRKTQIAPPMADTPHKEAP